MATIYTRNAALLCMASLEFSSCGLFSILYCSSIRFEWEWLPCNVQCRPSEELLEGSGMLVYIPALKTSTQSPRTLNHTTNKILSTLRRCVRRDPSGRSMKRTLLEAWDSLLSFWV